VSWATNEIFLCKSINLGGSYKLGTRPWLWRGICGRIVLLRCINVARVIVKVKVIDHSTDGFGIVIREVKLSLRCLLDEDIRFLPFMYR